MYANIGGKEDQFSGLIVVETDDVLGGGIGDKYLHAVSELRHRFKCGKGVDLMETSCEYGGRALKQAEDYSFNISMVRYLKDRDRAIKLDRGRCANPEAEAIDLEIFAMRGRMGKLNWATREGMPNGSGDASSLSATMPEPRVKDLQEANAALRRRSQSEAIITIDAILVDRLGLMVFADSSLGIAGGGSAQIAYILCAFHSFTYEGEEAPIRILTYKSFRTSRAGSATSLLEFSAMGDLLAEAEWLASCIGLVKTLHYGSRERNVLN